MIPDSIFLNRPHKRTKTIQLSTDSVSRLKCLQNSHCGNKTCLSHLHPGSPSPSAIHRPFFPACLQARLQLLKRYLPNLISRRPPQLPCTFPHTHTGSTAPSLDLASHVPRKKWPGVPGTGWDPAVRTLFTDQPSAISTLRNLHMTQICRQRCMCKIFLILISKFAAVLECKYPDMANIIKHTVNEKMGRAAYKDKT